MSVFNSNVEMAEPESVVAFFVPASSAAYVTELMELAFSSTTGVTVYAGEMSRVVAVDDESIEPDQPQSPSSVTSSVSSSQSINDGQDDTVSSSSSKRKMPMENVTSPKRQRTEGCGSFKCVPGTTNSCCVHKIADQLKQMYGEPTPLPNGRASAPRLMIQYPDLPYSVPLHPEFDNYGLPRRVVNFNSLGSFTASIQPTGSGVPPAE